MIKHGPVDVVVVAGGIPRFDGSIYAELERLAQAGIIRVLDAMLLVKTQDGQVGRLELSDLPEEDQAALGMMSDETRGLFDLDDEQTLAEGMVPGSIVFAMAVENLWAVRLVNAFDQAGAELAFQTRVPALIVDEAFASRATVAK